MTTPSHRPIFVVGCPRSGTTLLQQMLHCHPRIALPSETRFVHTSYDARHDFGDLERPENLRALGEWIAKDKTTKFKALKLDPDATIEEIAAAPPTLGSAIATVFRGYARENGKPRWGDKRPSYIRRIGALRRMFPDAQFVHLIRDGRDAVSSLNRMPWYDGDLFSAALTWRDAVDIGRRLGTRLGPETFYEFRYEDLVEAPERELTRLCAFLGEEYDPAMAAPQHHARATVPQERRWHLRTHEAPNAGSSAPGRSAWRNGRPTWSSTCWRRGSSGTGTGCPDGRARPPPMSRGSTGRPRTVRARAAPRPRRKRCSAPANRTPLCRS
ncbi:sulfotransferase family protein [Actinomadura sp. CNU-125]|uniref:sulfotransferase family protein n=1 Tax=Actinomadura sp. CNU-125 TaxID=1904961 RepID=UPI000B214864|nr:sulfotransferase [Actinomadura sp. CNU-125]